MNANDNTRAKSPEDMIFPILNDREWKRLPTIFKEIIEWDYISPIRNKVVSIKELAEWKYSRNIMNLGAQNFISKQKGGTGGARS